MVGRFGRSALATAACLGFSAAQLWAAGYLTTSGAPSRSWRLDDGFGAILFLAGLATAGAGVWAGITARSRRW
jgi:hypothetical protein